MDDVGVSRMDDGEGGVAEGLKAASGVRLSVTAKQHDGGLPDAVIRDSGEQRAATLVHGSVPFGNAI